ncbi:MAG TPA: hypothetical protein VHC97_10725 [Thermoanaerobaculia bacterium]|jgi:hypothetical protein|nr:hypothetical protein [Thermoanaerobaculia bacterium]
MMKKRAVPLVVILAFLFLPTPSPAFPLMGAGLIRQFASVSESIVRALVGIQGKQPRTKAGSCTDPDGRPRPCN